MTSLSAFWVTRDRFEFGNPEKELGHGAFGRVVEATDKQTGKKVAVKFLLAPPQEIGEQRALTRELSILATTTHPATLRLIGFSFTPDPMIVTDIMPGGTLTSALKKPPRGWGPTQLSICIFGIAAGMAHLHRLNIIHRDLKPDNVFLNAQLEPVIADFGISRHSAGAGVQQTMAIGTPLFMAPELYEDEGYGPDVDVYAFAVLIYSFFAEPSTLDDTGQKFKSRQDLGRRLRKGARFTKPPGIPEAHWELITAAWDRRQHQRPSFQEMIDNFQEQHLYLMPGADPAKVMAYEKKIMAFSGASVHLSSSQPMVVLPPPGAADPLGRSFALDPLARSMGPASPPPVGGSAPPARPKPPADFDWDD